MALMACPSCKKQMSSKAESCPHCGWSRVSVSVGASEELLAARAEARRKSKANYRLQMLGMLGVIVFAGGGWFWYEGLTNGNARDSQMGQWILAAGFLTYLFARGWILWNRHGDKLRKS